MYPYPNLYLASKSPRRKALLAQVGIDFGTLILRDNPQRTVDVDEVAWDGEPPLAYCQRVAQQKADKAWQVMSDRNWQKRPILSADTTVVIRDLILGKPENEQRAIHMMRLLSGQTHHVITCIAIRYEDQLLQAAHTSQVKFRALSNEEITLYCQTKEPYDKAGGYGIQGLAAQFISHIEGSYSSIMGLPIFETCELLKQLQSDSTKTT